MSRKTEQALRLLIVDDNVEDAEAIVSGLRNAGIAVRPVRAGSLDELGGILSGQPLDIVLAAQRSQLIPLAGVLQQAIASGKDVPVVALHEDLDAAGLADALLGGARAVALRGNQAQLHAALRSEWSDLEARRALRRLEAQVRETERRCDALIDSSREPIAYIHEGMHIRANPAYLEMFGFDSFEDVEGMSLLDLVAPAHVEAFKQLLKSLSKGEPAPDRHELQARDSEGNDFPAVMEFTQALYEGEPCLQVVFRKQEQAFDPELAREVEELRQRDQATGLYNRTHFLQVLEAAVAQAAEGGAVHGVLLVEPDHYQRLLQEIGLGSADAAIASMARRLAESLEGDAMAARFGEHSFAVLLRGADHAVTSAQAEAVRHAFSSHVFALGERSGAVTASIGGVQVGEKIASVSRILAKAAEGLRAAAAVGGNRVELFDPSAADRAEEEHVQAWVARLRDAIDRHAFVLLYQPVIDLQGGNEPIYDVYARLDAGDGELISPAVFLHIAEEHGLLGALDREVVEAAIAAAAAQQRRGKPVSLMVKVSEASLGDAGFAGFLAQRLAQHGVPGQALTLLLPEAKVFTYLREAQAFAAAVGQLGCRLGLEQFGAGLDSFQLLAHLKPDYLRLDRSFVEDLSKNPANQTRVEEIAGKGRELGIATVAGFVQDAASMSILFASGVAYVEGDFLAPAGPDMDYDFG